MEIIIRSEHHSGYGLDALEDQISDALGDRGRITGGGGGIDGWHLYVEIQDASEEGLNRVAASLGRLNLPEAAFIQINASDGSKRKRAIQADRDRDSPRGEPLPHHGMYGSH